ncbi:hypothetical protein P9112_005687 [Eukaryota sp. TZLM1-RC]
MINPSEQLLIPKKQNNPTIGGVLGFTYLSIGIAMPFYNYALFHSKGKVLPGFPFPITSTLLQLLGVVLVLSIIGLFRKLPSHRRAFGRLFMQRLSILWPASLSQAVNIVLMNTGLFMLDVSLHVLLRASEIVWVVVLSLCFKKERPTLKVVLSCLVTLIGTCFIVLHIVSIKGISGGTMTALIVHFFTTILSALNIVSFRVLSTKLKTCLIHPIDATELTILNLTTMSILIIPCVAIWERDAISTLFKPNPALWIMLSAGLVITSLYKLSFTALITHTTAITVGVVAQMKIVPQVVLDVVVNGKYGGRGSKYLVIGSLVTFVGVIWYTILKYNMAKQRAQLELKN